LIIALTLQKYSGNNMCRYLICMVLLISNFSSLKATTIRGSVNDAKTGEELVGANILIKEMKQGTITGLDGTYAIKNIPKGNYTIICSYISYQKTETYITVTEAITQTFDFNLLSQNTELNEVNIVVHRDKSTDASARNSERNSDQVLNVVSAKTIELSPDLTVANVIQRVSGVTLERNSSGDGQYAILRGMDKRFNYTMVNGMKIPSPDNKNRFVPLDIFPSELLDRLEVTKSATANMEGDGIGGAVNMVMKDAPRERQFTGNLSTGYNSLFFNNEYQSFDVSALNAKSPNEKYGIAYPVQMKDFTTKNLHLNSGNAIPNLSGGFSLGDRYLKDKLGIILAGSYQKSIRGNSSDVYSTTLTADGQQNITHRFFSNQQTRMGFHAKFD
jgi:hypothetical protein